MPKGPGGQRRPADVNARAVMIAKIATGEIEDARPSPESEGKHPGAVALGRMGGKARAAAMSPRRRKQIARQAAEKRWKSINKE
ncbi:MAG: RNA-binding protein [Xanthobacteraceae bacterium]